MYMCRFYFKQMNVYLYVFNINKKRRHTKPVTSKLSKEGVVENIFK